MTRTLPVLRWPGGKSRHLKTLLPLIPAHTCYVEPFAGGLAVLLAKPRSKVEVINDTNRDLVALYRCAQFHLRPLLDETQWMLGSRDAFRELPTNRGLTDLQRAARFLAANVTSFGGMGSSFAVAKTMPSGGLHRKRILTRLTALRDRLDGVAVECSDWEHCVRLYDSPETFLFLDPPYLDAHIRAYSGWSQNQMRHLADLLPTLQGQWILTVDGSPFCRELFTRWPSISVSTRSGTVNQRTHSASKYPELIITSAPLPRSLSEPAAH